MTIEELKDKVTRKFTEIELNESSASYSGTLGNFIATLLPNVILKGHNMSCDSCLDGRYAQVSLCEGCKWTSNFVVPTVAY